MTAGMTDEDVVAELIARRSRPSARLRRWLWKWLWCSWRHRRDRCYPEVWKAEPTRWHCAFCHPCGEGLDALLEALGEGEDSGDAGPLDFGDIRRRAKAEANR